MKEVQIPPFSVIGSNVRTNNAAEMSGSGKIPGLWGEFYSSHNNLSGPIFGVYSEYESDATGDFTVTAGTQAEADESSVTIAGGTYLEFPAEGEMPGAIISAWQQVWEYFLKESAQERAYQTDFEQYNGPTSAAIYIGIKNNSN